jgi:murein hydrolase activator
MILAFLFLRSLKKLNLPEQINMNRLKSKISAILKTGNVILLLSFFILLPCISGAQTLKELKERKEKTKKQIEYINLLLNETGENTKVTMNKLSMLNRQIELRNNLIIDYNTQLSMLDKSIGDNLITIQMMTEDLQRLRDQYANMIRQAFRNRGNYSQLVFLLSSENFNQAYKRMLYIRQMARYRQKQATEIEALKNVLEQKTNDLSNRKQEQTEVLNQQIAESSKLNLEKERQSNFQKQLQRREKELKKDLSRQQKIEEQLQRRIEEFITQEVKKTKATPVTHAEQKMSDDFEKNKGLFPWPTSSGTGIITDHFGEHSHSVMRQIIIKNDGIDITTNPGEKARSIFNGTVSRVFALPGGNMAVIIRHGEYITVYSNLKEVFVKQGDNVTTKQEIGLIFTDTFDDNKTTLKFQIRRETLKLDPEEWISR